MRHLLLLALPCALLCSAAADAAVVDVTVTVENLADPNGVSFAPLRFGFHSGVFDAFDNGAAATAPIISIAEGGSGADWFPAFAAADPAAVLGSTGGALLPGATFTTMAFRVDTALNPFFTFGSMVIPSNDLFIGNDDTQRYRLFDAAGGLLIGEINQTAGQIWNAGSETADPLAAAFLVIGNNGLRTPEGGVVEFSFSELAAYEGLTTAAGYDFTAAGLTGATPIYRISFGVAAVPEPAAWATMILGFGFTGVAMRRRATRQAATA